MPRSVLIGIHVAEGSQHLDLTLFSLRQHASGADVVLLPDRVSPETLSMAGKPVLRGDRPGRAAAFNRLAAYSRHPLVILLECGCQVGPGWLDRLREALDADPRHGLAGPSTNRAWNEQQAIACRDTATPFEVSSAAYRTARRFGRTWRTLEPLHSLGDFCYAVRRSVIDTIGGADEAYGVGPCWEMDYNIRAARAGFLGVWARGAFVHRAPAEPIQDACETAALDAGRRLYQSRFCALQLRGERSDFEAHCRGEACEHFAPRELIRVAQPLEMASTAYPLVTCVVATGAGRRGFLQRSILYFDRQDYPNRELLIVDDGPDDLVPIPRGVRYHRLTRRLSIGAKRNLGCELAGGEIIAQWDDDDWYGPERLTRQVQPLLDGRAEITGLAAHVFFDLRRWEFWTCTPELHRRLFVGDVCGGTLVYWRRLWEQMARYPDISLAEDAGFLAAVMERGARLERVLERENPPYIYLRHGANTWSFECGTFLDPAGWSRVPEPAFDEADRAFYAAMAGSAAHTTGAAAC